jgi:hypothetical protein
VNDTEFEIIGATKLAEEALASETKDEAAPIELSFDEYVEQVRDTLRRNPLNREILYRILKYCERERRQLPDLEERIASYPEFKQATQPPYFLIMWLVEAGGLAMFEIDAEGAVVTDERKEGLDENEIDDLVEGWAFETNEVGRAIVREFDPQHRLINLLNIVPERYKTFVEVLSFLENRRPFADVDSLLRGRDILSFGLAPGDRPMQPSVFIDKLEAAGGIFWNDGWQITTEGKELLETIKKRMDD